MIELTERERRLLWEIVTMVDPDTLCDNLNRVGAVSDDASLDHELTQLQELLDPDELFLTEWMQLKDE